MNKFEKEYLGIKRENIPELNKKYLDGLSPQERKDIEHRWRLVKEWEDEGVGVGTVLLNNVSADTFIEFRKISRRWFGNSDGPCLAGLVNNFLAFKKHENTEESNEIVASDGNRIKIEGGKNDTKS